MKRCIKREGGKLTIQDNDNSGFIPRSIQNIVKNGLKVTKKGI